MGNQPKDKPPRYLYDDKKQKEVPVRPKFYSIRATKYAEKRPNYSHQADLIFLGERKPSMEFKKYYEKFPNKKPEDVDGIFILADVATRKVAMEFVANKTAFESFLALREIYNTSDDFKIPTRLITDDGNEWEAEFTRYLKANKIEHVKKLQGQTLGLVDRLTTIVKQKLFDKMNESRNKIDRAIDEGTQVPEPINVKKLVRQIEKEINKRVPVEEYEKQEGETYKDVKEKTWSKRYDPGKEEKEKPIVRIDSQKKEPGPNAGPRAKPQYKRETKKQILPLGTIVKRQLYRSERKGGDVRLRAGDYRYSEENYKITNIYLTPGSVPMYELQEVDKDNKPQFKRGKQVHKTQPLTSTPVPYHEVKPLSYFKN